ncbi:MAG: lysophospholipase [Sterolibacterium sp.]|jgi:alpha-beta hydrolase superfamily lysophospholipase
MQTAASDPPTVKTAAGLALHTRLWPAAEPRAMVVLTHGFGEHCGRYGGLARELNAAGYSLFAYDLRGHGLSEGARGFVSCYEDLLDDLAQVIAAAQREQSPFALPLFLFGHSMGGNIVLNYALRRPAGIRSILVSGPWLRLSSQPPAWKLALGKLTAALLPKMALPAAVDPGVLSHDPQQVRAYADDPLVHGTMTARLFAEVAAAGEWALAHAAGLSLPALLMHGGGDRLIDSRATEEFHRRAGGDDKRLRIYAGQYHEILNESDPGPVLQDIVEWIGRRI